MVLSFEHWLPVDLPKDYWNNKLSYHIERSWEDIDKSLPTPIWRVCVDIKNCVAVVLTSADTWNQLSELRWDLEWDERKQFIEKLKQLPDYEWSQLQKAVNWWKLQITKTQPTNYINWWLELNVWSKYALYEKWWNLLYIVWLNWEKYFNVDRVRHWVTNAFLETGLELNNARQKLENWLFNLYIWNRKVEFWWEEYNNLMLIASELSLRISQEIKDGFEKIEKEEWIK